MANVETFIKFDPILTHSTSCRKHANAHKERNINLPFTLFTFIGCHVWEKLSPNEIEPKKYYEFDAFHYFHASKKKVLKTTTIYYYEMGR